ncbi:WSCD family member CG9164-like [Pomacea canaliculata]|uniref:WSCD family member CG9164-like n=1 Tax=Pomacea canaliculata TaxID=400727 RepID=UPI000D72EF8C|nr:WSCD family member CG9164-like [Pomacea canaliculata]XP_025089088.1 WSCD family member CG9164-like [Pomacea canaliculata]
MKFPAYLSLPGRLWRVSGWRLWLAALWLLTINLCSLYLLSTWVAGQGVLLTGGWMDGRGACRRLRLVDPPHPVTALASVPGSGSTWLRHLLHQTTGLATGSLYSDSSLTAAGFLGEGIHNSSVLVVKTHASPSAMSQDFRQALLLMRNPYDVILAEFNRRQAGHLGHAREDDFATYWDSFVPEAAEFWRIVNTDWLDFPGRLLVVHYEQLVHSLNSTLSDILHFLNITHTASDLQCAATHSRGDFKRQEPREGRENILAKRFSSKHREFIHRCGMAVATKLSDTGHGHLPYSLVTPLYRMENTRATGNYPGRT